MPAMRWKTGKEEIMQEARQKAEDIVANAHVRADQIKEDAQAEAQAMDVSARDQAKPAQSWWMPPLRKPMRSRTPPAAAEQPARRSAGDGGPACRAD